MKNIKFPTLQIVATIAMFLVSLSCSSSDDSPVEHPFLTIKSISTKSLSANGGETIISVGSRPAASAVSDAGWLSLKSTTPLENHTSFVFVAEANKGDLRKANITITAGDKHETLIISQEKGENSGIDPADESQPAVIVARELGLGWNLGNQLDAHANNVSGETLWGNGKATQETLHKVKEAGFTSVRIPVTWLGKVGAAPDYLINSEWLERVAEVVGYAEQAGLKAIINIHHDGHRSENEPGHWLDITKAATSTAANEAIKAQLSAMWTQIAEHFKEKGEFLIFEGVNEIHDGKWGYGDNTSDGGKQYAILNEWQQTFVDAVRAVGGNNATRYLGISGYTTNPELTMKHLKLPEDTATDRLLVSVHYYDPHEFTLTDKYGEWGHTGAAGKKEQWGDEEHMRKVFADLKATYVDKGIPVYIGEMGCVHRSDSRSESFRKYYLEYLCKAARTYGMAAFYWDNGSTGTGHESSGLIDHATGNFVNNGKEIVEVMVRGYITTDASYTLETVYQNAPQ